MLLQVPITWKRSLPAAFVGATMAAVAGSALAITPFQADVNAAIDAGLNWSRTFPTPANNQFNTDTEGNGLTLLTLLEKGNIPFGYAGLVASDQSLARQAACVLMTSSTFGARGGFYAYTDGQVLMGLAVFANTGGPDAPAECVGSSVRSTINTVVDRSVAAQTTGTPAAASYAGYWGYTGPGSDSSTTQFAASGLGAAKGYYLLKGDSLPARLPAILTALDRTSNAYSLNGKVTSGAIWDAIACDTATPGHNCQGHGYQTYYGAPGSNQQTGSGAWLQLLGTGKNVNNAGVQAYMRWLRAAYNYNTNTSSEGWPPAYLYYLWSSSKAYNFMETMAVGSGNIGPADLGTLPALSSGGYARLANRNPVTDVRVPQRGADGAGFYSASSPGWYYDYAYRVMGLQLASGQFSNPNGTWNQYVDHAYALLVLQRSVGGIVVNAKCDVNSDGQITRADLALISAARGTTGLAVPNNDPRDSNNDGKIDMLDVKVCIPLVH